MLVTPENEQTFFTGYAIDLEDRQTISKMSVDAEYLMMGDLPDRVDPRQTILYKEGGWLPTEDQGQIGSCQGQALTENFEYNYTVDTGQVLQFSRMYAYIGSQKKDNIRGDRGSTLSGGTKLALEGICPEKDGPYTNRYPGWEYITPAMVEAAKPYKMQSSTIIKSAIEMKQYIGSGIGIVQIGIPWGSSNNPDAKHCITSFAAGRGGHSVSYCGYVPDDVVGVRSGFGYWFLKKNSWGRRWGLNGFAYVRPDVVDAQIRHNFSTFVGRSSMVHPHPRPLSVDFTKDGFSIN
jgi:C1A family cysteine protease